MKVIKTMIAVIAMVMVASAANAQSNNKGNDGYSCFSVMGVFDTDFGQNPLPLGVYSINDEHGSAIKILDDHTFKIFFKALVMDDFEVSDIGQYYEVTPGIYRFECQGWSEDFFLDGEDIVSTHCERWYRE